MRYLILIEGTEAGGNLSAYVPDLPSCVATGTSHDELEREARAERDPLPSLRRRLPSAPGGSR
jgi:hypothetical protein